MFTNMEIGTTETLAETHASLSSELDNPQPLEPVQAGDNGAGFSANGIICVSGDLGIADTTRVIVAEISVEKILGAPNRSDVGGVDGGSVGDSKVTDADSTVLIGDGSDGKVEFDLNRDSLVGEVYSPLDSEAGDGKIGGHGYHDKGSMAENGGDTGSAPMMGENEDETGEKERRDEVNDTGKKNEHGDQEDEGDLEHKFSVGDFVWGKISSYPWWPGRIYYPSEASDYARRYSQRKRLLVAHFGDGSFSWCSPSQLKPFAEDFEQMSKQSDSKRFLNAIGMALDEIGRLVELKTTCSCIYKENGNCQPARPLAMNAGIKKGVLVPDCNPLRQLEPEMLIAFLRNIAEGVYSANVLELTVVRSWLSAFYQAKGGHKLVTYHLPTNIEGLEDKSRDGVAGLTDIRGPVECPIQVPFEEDLFSSPVNNGFVSLLQKCSGMVEDKLYTRRKTKSVSEFMEEVILVEPGSNIGSQVKDVKNQVELVSTSGKKKRKSSAEAVSQCGSDFTSPSGKKRERRKKAKILGSPVENKVLNYKKGEGGEGTKECMVSNIEIDNINDKEEGEGMSASRGSDNTTKDVQMGERMTRVAGQLFGSPPFVNEHEKLAATPVSLIVTFPPGFSLPTKDDLITIFSAFGPVNEMKTGVLPNSYCARVVFVNSADAEAAVSTSAEKNPFGPARVQYRLQYSFAASRAPEGYLKASSTPKECNKGPANPAALQLATVNEASQLLVVKQKLEMMKSMLEKSDGNTLLEMKSSLEGEMKNLLAMVSTMVKSTSSGKE